MIGQKQGWGMAKLAGVLGATVFFVAVAPIARASDIDLFDFALSTSTGTSADWQDGGSPDPTTLILNTSTIYNDTSCCGDSTTFLTPGLGTVNYMFTGGAAGTYSVSLYFDYDVSVPFFNEYGLINNAGSAESGVEGEIFNADIPTNDIVLYGACGSTGCETYGNADGLNEVPGNLSDYNANCANQLSENVQGPTTTGATSATCNADVGMALTYSFTTAFAGQNVLITALSTIVNPGGFSLETLHPIDPNNTAGSQVYLTGTYTLQGPPQTGVPEPSTWVLLGCALAFFGTARGIRRRARV